MPLFLLITSAVLLLGTRAQVRPAWLVLAVGGFGFRVWLDTHTLELWELLAPHLDMDPASRVVDAVDRWTTRLCGVPLLGWGALALRGWARAA